ncbi:MAG: histidinol dehydrogenase [Planctomycetes bacterium]|nr:histidinol dehydrogenase [Planctomycetota bacterium]
MRVLRSGTDEFDAELKSITSRSVVADIPVTKEGMERTRRVFGAPLSPAQVVERIISDIRERGDEALLEYSQKLDGVAFADPSALRVSHGEVQDAYSGVKESFVAAVRKAKKNIASFQYHIKPTKQEPLHSGGVTLGMEYHALERVGIYIPGGQVPYASTVLMNVIPAQVAGVLEVVVCTPPNRKGEIAPHILVALDELKVTEIYKLGGAQAIAALALGTKTIRKVDKVAGPGNAFVAMAKRQVFGYVDIDMFAGPSEILIVADENAPAEYVAADLLSQAEHAAGTAILVTDSDRLAHQVAEEIQRQVEALAKSDMVRECLEKYGFIIVTKDIREGISIANRVAPEHLEIITAKPAEVVPWIRNVGTVFVGPYSPVAVGDYVAGPSHTLPTGGTARFSSGLSVLDFMKRSSFVSYTKAALQAHADALYELARAEGYDAHAKSVAVRLR